ncbi:MAG TPA: hypothetical protein VGB61_08020, partial [Pyrinomonadaceae bacterium]
MKLPGSIFRIFDKTRAPARDDEAAPARLEPTTRLATTTHLEQTARVEQTSARLEPSADARVEQSAHARVEETA